MFQAAKHLNQWGNTTKLFYPNTFSLSQIINMNRFPYAYYHGSLTTPPCSEAVLWIVITRTVDVQSKQLKYFRLLKGEDENPLVNNYRPTQNLNGRVIVVVSTKSQ